MIVMMVVVMRLTSPVLYLLDFSAACSGVLNSFCTIFNISMYSVSVCNIS